MHLRFARFNLLTCSTSVIMGCLKIGRRQNGGFQYKYLPLGYEGDGSSVVANFLDEARHLLLDLLEPGTGVGWLGGVHLVDSDDEQLDAKSVGK